jgi:hypothetical protein
LKWVILIRLTDNTDDTNYFEKEYTEKAEKRKTLFQPTSQGFFGAAKDAAAQNANTFMDQI